jgi:SAM-dependent methyltransferase
MVAKPAFPAGFFDRQDESDDSLFYALPRFVQHIDPETIAALTSAYRDLLPEATAVLDLMSSWVSHLPIDRSFRRVAGLGMNQAELEKNPLLSDHAVQDLNREPTLPYSDESFDAVVNAVSIQYLTRPVEVFREVGRVLIPGGQFVVAMSHRCFPTKAVRAWHVLPLDDRLEVVERYFALSEAFEPAEILDRSPRGADPLWLVVARKRE